MRNIWFDTETTGLDKVDDQILEAAIIVDDESGVEIERHEFLVKLKDGVIPSPMALATNGLNPFSKEYSKNAITEAEFVRRAEEIAKNNTIGNKKPRMIAFNGGFDRNFTTVAFARQGRPLNESFSKSLIDPMKLAENAIEMGLLKTKLNGYGKPSKKQVDVAEALGVKYSEKGAHRAIADVEVMRAITPKLYAMITKGENFYQSAPSVGDFEVGQVYQVTTNSKSSGLKNRHIRVIHNDPDAAKIIAVDEADIKENGNKFSDSSIRTFNYDTIVKESPVVSSSKDSLDAIYNTKKQEIDSKVAAMITPKQESSIFDEDTKNHNLVVAVQKRMHTAKDKRNEYEQVMKDLAKDLNGSKISAKTILTKAERYQESLGLPGWIKDIQGGRTIKALTFDPADGEMLKVVLHPDGNFYYQYNYGDGYMVKDIAKSKRDLINALKGKSTNEKELFSMIESLPAPSTFKDAKHPSVMEADLKKALEILKAEKNPAKIEAVHSLIERLKELAPGTYSKYKNDQKNYDPLFYLAEYDEQANAYQPSFDGLRPDLEGVDSVKKLKVVSGTETESDQIQQGNSAQMSLDDHMPSGQKSSVKCSVCSRSLSKEISKIMGMGPTCKARANFVDSSIDEPSVFVDTMTTYTRKTASTIKVGDALVVKYRDDSGENELFVDSFRFTLDNKAVFVNRKKLKALLSDGEDFAIAEYKATVSINDSDILSIGKLSSKKIDSQRLNKVAA